MCSNNQENQTEAASLHAKPFLPAHCPQHRRLFFPGESLMLPSRSSVFCLLALFGVSGSMPVLAQSSPVEVSAPNHQIAVRFSVQAGNVKQAGESDAQLV